MLDSVLAPRLSSASALGAALLTRAKVPPAHQTGLGFAFAIIATGFVVARLPWVAVLPLLLGWSLRRLAPPSPLDRLLEFLSWSAPTFAFAIADPPRALASTFLIFGLAVMDVAKSSDPQGAPTLTRPVEQTELLFAFLIACLFPNLFSIVAYVIGILCFVSAGFSLARSSGQ